MIARIATSTRIADCTSACSCGEADTARAVAGMLAKPCLSDLVFATQEVTFYDYQFFDEDRLRPLLEKERGISHEVGPDGMDKIVFKAKEELVRSPLLGVLARGPYIHA